MFWTEIGNWLEEKFSFTDGKLNVNSTGGGDSSSPALIASVATGGSNTTLVDTTLSLITDKLTGYLVVITSATTGKKQIATIASNTSNTLTFSALAGLYAVVAGDTYQIIVDPSNTGAINKATDSIQAFLQVEASSLGAVQSFSKSSTADANMTSVKASSGKMTSLIAHNNTASAKFIKLYNKASAPVIINDTSYIIARHTIPANSNLIINSTLDPLFFSAGIAYAITGAVGDTDATILASNDVSINIKYV